MSKIEEIERAIEQLPPDDFARLSAWIDQRRGSAQRELDEEDRLDLEAVRKSLAETGENVPWEQVKRDAGLK